ncbi:hypothetical protein [Vibrio phage VEN]|uniref:Uncharacterized protein n=1 Tax=Vibrio phage VEN TaxID=2059879 RepID=A0A2H5BMZ5_9CAUD|nr:hypothetical protein HOS56_gp08 [Vibrio phage VEN]AUG87673.1 hypothetical protein [Vibrio phage VEN]
MSTIKQKDRNRAELVQALIRQNGGKIFTVVAKRKSPKSYFVVGKFIKPFTPTSVASPVVEGDKVYLNTKRNQHLLDELMESGACEVTVHNEHFMELTCRTGVKKGLKGGESTIKHCPDLISVNLTNGKGYRCFSAFNVLEIRAGGAIIKFKEEDVLAFEG